MDQTIREHIESKPGVCGGKACITGTRIRVQDIFVWHEMQGQSADAIVSQFPQLSLADVYAALAYYWDHRDEIDRQMQEETALVESMKRSGSSPLQRKLAGSNGANDPVSPG